MKKLTALIVSTILMGVILTGCSKYTVEKPELTKENIQQYEQAIEDGMGKLKNKDITDVEKVETLQSIGVGYERLGKYNRAINYYEQILEIAPTNFIALNNLVAIYEEVGELNLAEKYVVMLYESYKQDTNTNQEVVNDTIRILTKDKKFDQALNVLQEYARDFQGDMTEGFISERFEFISRMRDAEANK